MPLFSRPQQIQCPTHLYSLKMHLSASSIKHCFITVVRVLRKQGESHKDKKKQDPKKINSTYPYITRSPQTQSPIIYSQREKILRVVVSREKKEENMFCEQCKRLGVTQRRQTHLSQCLCLNRVYPSWSIRNLLYAITSNGHQIMKASGCRYSQD